MPQLLSPKHAIAGESSIRRVLNVVALGVCALLIAAAVPHTTLRSTVPAADSTVTESPARISMWFTGRVQRAFSRIRIVDASGDTIRVDSIVADTGNGLHAILPRVLGAGRHRVIWQTASADGHTIRGEFAFNVAAAASPDRSAITPPSVDTVARPASTIGPRQVVAPITPGSVPGPADNDLRSVRWMEFVALLTILGVIGFRHVVLPPLAARGVPTADAAERALRLGVSAALLYLLAALIRIVRKASGIDPELGALAPEVLRPLLFETLFGTGWMVGAIAALFLLVSWTVFRQRVAIGTPLALTGALGMALAPALTGHAAADGRFVLSVTADVTHVASAGLWLGTLFMVVVAGIPAMKRLVDGNVDAAAGALVTSFHPLALVCAPLTVVAGLMLVWLRLGSLNGVTTHAYGRILLLKLALFAGVAAIGFYNAARARKRMGSALATVHIRRTMIIELALATAVIGATSVLVSTPLPVINP